MNFKVPTEFKKDFQIATATYGCTQVERSQRIFYTGQIITANS
ncbi:hypothetical protein [Nostoc sp. WHI]|nr:hypothetical protein [Nostoc sp. WHI]